MGFILFVLVNVMLFVRPGEIFPAVEGLPLYNYSILACLAVSLPSVVRQLSPRAMRDRPITACAVGFLGAIIMSHLAQGSVYEARVAADEFYKVLLYYFLLVGLLNTPARLRLFLFWLVGLVLVLSLLALAQYHGFIHMRNLEVLDRNEVNEKTGEVISVIQLRSTGIFNDPNDLCLILVVGMAICLYWHNDRKLGPFRFVWLGPLVAFGYALLLTRSRGGFLAMLATLLTFMASRLGFKRSMPLAVVVLPLMFLIFGGRSTNISASDGTAQSRMQLWAEGFQLLMTRPVFGIGANMFAEEVRHVAHNTYVHSFTELGFVGGTCFVGAFYCAVSSLVRRGTAPRAAGADPEMERLRSYLLAMTAGYAVGLFSLSRGYVIPTYLVLGLVAAYQGAAPAGPDAALRLDFRLARRIVAAGACSLTFLYVFTRVFARFD